MTDRQVQRLTKTLLNPEVAPLSFGHEVGLGDELGQVLGQHDVAVLELVVSVLVTVVDIFLGHGGWVAGTGLGCVTLLAEISEIMYSQ